MTDRGFAGLARRVGELPEGDWTKTEAPDASVASGNGALAQAKRKRRSFDDGSEPPPRFRLQVSGSGILLAILILVIISGILGSGKDAGRSTGSAGTANQQVEEKPPVGTGLILTISQIRFCEYERVRMETLEPLIDHWFAAQKFREQVADYNSRCSNFRYRNDALQRVQAEVPGMKPALESQGKAIYANWNTQFSSWFFVPRPNKEGFFYMRSSLARKDNFARADFLHSSQEVKYSAMGKPYKSVRTQRYFDCASNTTGLGQTTHFSDVMGKGDVTEETQAVPINKVKFAAVEQGSTTEAQMRLACRPVP